MSKDPTPSPTAPPTGKDNGAEILAGLVEILRDDMGVFLEDDPGQQSFDSLDVDSLSKVELAVAVEERFSVSIEDDDIRTLNKLDDVVKLVQKKLGPPPGPSFGADGPDSGGHPKKGPKDAAGAAGTG